MNTPNFQQLLKSPSHLLAFGFGSGLAPKAPGTFGTLAAIPLYLVLMQSLSVELYGTVLVVTFIAGIFICDRSSKALGVHDHPGIVWDEFVGFWLTMWLLPKSWIWVVAGFIGFRFFDIVKPWPIKWVDKHVGGGFGIMVDDILAGVMAAALLLGAEQLLLPLAAN